MSARAPEREDQLAVVDDGEQAPQLGEPKPGRATVLLTRLRTPRPAGSRTTGRLAALTVTTIVSLLALWLLLFAFVLSGLQESRSQRVLYAQLREGLSGATTPFGGQTQPGTPLMTVNAPQLGLNNTVVVEGTVASVLDLGPGHLANTPMPGQAGTSVLFGRSVTFGAPFGKVGTAKAGTQIVITTGQGTFHYIVDRVRRPGDPLPAAPSAGTSRVTFVTSAGTGWRAGWAPQETLYLDATMSTSDKIQPTPPGRPTVVPDAARPMQGDPAALLPLVFWLQGFIIIAVAVVWTRSRWSLWQTWLVAVPLFLACLWGSTAVASQLLPNLI